MRPEDLEEIDRFFPNKLCFLFAHLKSDRDKDPTEDMPKEEKKEKKKEKSSKSETTSRTLFV
jgi:hypothetical protein